MSDTTFRYLSPLALLCIAAGSFATLAEQPRPLQDPPLLEINRTRDAPCLLYTSDAADE